MNRLQMHPTLALTKKQPSFDSEGARSSKKTDEKGNRREKKEQFVYMACCFLFILAPKNCTTPTLYAISDIYIKTHTHTNESI